MKDKKHTITLKRLLPLLLIVILMLGQTAFAASAPADGNTDLDYLKSVMDLIQDQYKGDISDPGLVQGAVGGMFGSLDPYTTYFTPKEAQSFMSTIGGSFSGIGVSLDQDGDYIIITEVFAGSPAEKAGILPSDRIVKAGGTDLVGKTPNDAVTLITGETGTTVRLGIMRDGWQDVKYFDITRGTVKVNPVQYEIRNGIGYIKLEMFNENADEFINNALKEIDKNGITKIVLDLRDNPGGDVDQAVAVARHFVPKGIITTLDYKSDSRTDEVYTSYLSAPRYKLAVLVNGNSASASEIVSGAVQDTAAGRLVGTKTYGKGCFQEMIPILTPDAYAKYENQLGVKIVNAYDLIDNYNVTPLDNEIAGYAKMTLGLYYTPKGRMINGVGLTPDYAVSDPAKVNGIAIDGVKKLTGAAKLGLNAESTDVYNAEEILKLMGYDVGAPDYILDKKTSDAVKAFQKDSKLWAYGVLDISTQKALNDALDDMLPKVDLQYAKAVEILNQQ